MAARNGMIDNTNNDLKMKTPAIFNSFYISKLKLGINALLMYMHDT